MIACAGLSRPARRCTRWRSPFDLDDLPPPCLGRSMTDCRTIPHDAIADRDLGDPDRVSPAPGAGRECCRRRARLSANVQPTISEQRPARVERCSGIACVIAREEATGDRRSVGWGVCHTAWRRVQCPAMFGPIATERTRVESQMCGVAGKGPTGPNAPHSSGTMQPVIGGRGSVAKATRPHLPCRPRCPRTVQSVRVSSSCCLIDSSTPVGGILLQGAARERNDAALRRRSRRPYRKAWLATKSTARTT